MRLIFIPIIMVSLNSFAGLQVVNCSNNDLEFPVYLCFESLLNKGNIKIQGEKIQLRFSSEDPTQADFILTSSSQAGMVHLLNGEAKVQIGIEEPIYLTCEKFKPGYCK